VAHLTRGVWSYRRSEFGDCLRGKHWAITVGLLFYPKMNVVYVNQDRESVKPYFPVLNGYFGRIAQATQDYENVYFYLCGFMLHCVYIFASYCNIECTIVANPP